MRIKLEKYRLLFLLSVLALMLSACNATRFVPDEQYLLQKEISVTGNEAVKKETLQRAISLQPNTRMLLPRTFLNFYNAGVGLRQDSSFFNRQLLKIPSVRGFEQKVSKWLMEDIGEAPVLVDTTQLRKEIRNLKNVYFARGYFNANAQYHIDTLAGLFNQRKAKVWMEVQEGAAFVIDSLSFQLDETLDPEAASSFLAAYDTASCLLRLGENYNHDNFSAERERATQALRNSGYYSFTQNMISFSVDTTQQRVQAGTDSLRKSVQVAVLVSSIPPPYRIRNIQVNLRASSDKQRMDKNFTVLIDHGKLPEYNSELSIPEKYLSPDLDINFKVTGTLVNHVNYNFIARRIHLKEDSLFSFSASQLTQRKLQELRMFQYSIINYTLIDSLQRIDVEIDLQFAPQYQLKLGTEVFTTRTPTLSNNLPVIGGNIGIRNRNTFRSSEQLEFSLGGNIGFYSSDQEASQLQNVYIELGASGSLSFPRFLLPGLFQKDFSLLAPTTILTGIQRSEIRVEYDRFTTGLNLSYRWNHRKATRDQDLISLLTPFAVDFIFVNISPDFERDFVRQLPPAIQRDYEPRFSARTSYSFITSTYAKSRAFPSYYLRFLAEVGGNLPWLIERLVPPDNDPDDNLLFDRLFYGQFVKGSVEGKYYIPLGKNSELVFRGIIGAAKSYGNAQIVPLESRFFSGGINSMRGWQSNTLGPGRLPLDELRGDSIANRFNSQIAPGGEFLFELNGEWRLDLLSYLEIALFTDIGNVWFLGNEIGFDEEQTDKARFSFNNLRMGWDMGLGFRFDFSFLVLRLDIGQQLFAPDVGWILGRPSREIPGRRTQLNLGIGYPF